MNILGFFEDCSSHGQIAGSQRLPPTSTVASVTVSDVTGEPAEVTSVQENGKQSRNLELDSANQEDRNRPQRGVQLAQAATQVWTTKQLVLLYILYVPPFFPHIPGDGLLIHQYSIWLVQFVELFANGVVSTLSPYVTSSFASHSLLATSQIVASLCSGLIQLPYAKLMDIWGRPKSLVLMVACQTIGFIMLAGCNDVRTYCAARVFFQCGYRGIILTVLIIIADTSTLRHRALWIALSSTPTLATSWLFGPATDSIGRGIGWRWGMGVFAIVVPVVCCPLSGFLYYYQRKAQKMQLTPTPESHRSRTETFLFYVREFDLVGLFILALGLALFLLSLSLYSFQPQGWRSPVIICFIIFGGLLIVAFVLYERFWASSTFMPWALIKNRTVFFTYTMDCLLVAAFSIWATYFLSMLVLVWQQSITHSTYILNIHAVGATLSGLFVGIAVLLGMRLKYLAGFIAIPLLFLGAGLLYRFCLPWTSMGTLIMTQILLAGGMGSLIITVQLTVMAVAGQEQIPALIATETLMADIGAAFGSAVSGAIWADVLPRKLAEFLPPEDVHLVPEIFGSLFVQLSYAPGSVIRDAINMAYSASLRYMLITALCLYAGCAFCVLCWKNVELGKRGSEKGRL
ncbi:uncharacterized protein A1O9_08792 [Exophiala aquamarina CBS 119918]|uniref:Major facilitator superfamily (MFS) profile domain-containing protein n=1 Tax=Exophiala aquamarina CBS 119918 TaxID=1182545 RepID=A0A072P4U4_9EURO|nr:uncharacterized protein A1O9_08792 [Exophiala aquamarina CBS 119918]KEF55139.1 hypothetical protein A1O9_08792 [Exophiala aquamarina CBS 119918]